MKSLGIVLALGLTFGCLTPGWANPAGVDIASHLNPARTLAVSHATDPLSLFFLAP